MPIKSLEGEGEFSTTTRLFACGLPSHRARSLRMRTGKKKTTPDRRAWSLCAERIGSANSSNRPLVAIAPDVRPVDSFCARRDWPRGQVNRDRDSAFEKALALR